MARLRILLTADPIIPVPPTGYGGIERIVDALVHHYTAIGHEVGLVAHGDSSAPANARFAWPVHHVRGTIATLRNATAFHRIVRKFRPDIVHSFSRLAYLLPVLLTPQPIVMSYQRHTGGRQIALAAWLGGRTLRFSGCSEFIRRMGQISGGNWIAVPNFIEPAKFNFVSHVPADAPLVFLSRLDDIKGPDMAIAIARATGRRLVLAGNRAESGPQRAYFDQKIQPWLGRDGIEWIGEINDEKKNRLLGAAAALLVPIQWDEPFGIVFAEALACGTPVITCPRGATPEIVTDEVGFLIRSVEEGMHAVVRIASIDRSACRRRAEKSFSVTVVAERYIALYNNLLAARC